MQQNELKYSKIVNRELRKAEMQLYGELGDENGMVNGHYFARELQYMGQNYDEIKIRINCEGGYVSHGLSVFSEMIGSPARIVVQVDGIAASMGAILIAAADYVIMNDYARVMIHSPYFKPDNNEAVKKLSEKDKKSISIIRDMLVSMLAKRGIDKEAVDKMMTTANNWFTSDEALTAKLVDEVIITGKKTEMASLEMGVLVAKVIEFNTNPKPTEMKKLISKFQLPDDSNEEAVMTAVSKMETDHKEAITKLTEAKLKLVDKLIAVGTIAGTINTENEASFRKLAETDPELFASMVNVKKEDLQGHQTRLSDFIEKMAQAVDKVEAKEEKSWDWYQKNDPQALNSMRASNTAKYNKLKADYEAQFETK